MENHLKTLLDSVDGKLINFVISILALFIAAKRCLLIIRSLKARVSFWQIIN